MRLHYLLASVVSAALLVGPGSLQARPSDAAPCERGAEQYGTGELKAAFRTFFACAIAGDAKAQYSAAMMMRSGESNDDGYPNPYGARVFLEQSASQGYAQAVYTLGMEYDLGSEVFPRNPAMATELFREAALMGHVEAQVDLGTQYFLGRGGVPQDDTLAARWYEQAAGGGHWGAQFLIASMYEHGNGVRRDERLALRWYERAKSGGDELAPVKVEQLKLRIATRERQLRLD
jgi:TPR repeat protein